MSAATLATGAAPTIASPGALAATGPRVAVSDSVDSNGCHKLEVWNGSRRVKVIRSRSNACSTLGRQERIGDLLYVEWTARWRLVDARQAPGWRRLMDLWVTDGTTRGTDLVTTLRASHGASQASCGSGWGPVANRPIAFASWCTDPASGAWLNGRLVVAWGPRTERKPVPRPARFAIANRRIVTTGDDARGRELWVHDRVMRVVDLRPGPGSSNPRGFRTVGRLVRFTANDGHGRASWVTDGTRAGTHKVTQAQASAARIPTWPAGSPHWIGKAPW